MPSSPPPPPHPPSAVIQASPNTSDEALLHLLERAQSHDAAAQESSSSRNPTGNDLAGEMLSQRHAARRQRERDLDWDERDNERRARQLLDRLFPGEAGPPPPFQDDLSDPEEQDGDWNSGDALDFHFTHPGPLAQGEMGEEDEHIFGFDGDGMDDALMTLDSQAERGGMAADRYPERETDDMSSIWPGFLDQRPLNPPFSSRPSVPPVVASTLPSSRRSTPRDPSSSTSYTSFLQPGVVFNGMQTFAQVEMAASLLRRHQAAATRSTASTASSARQPHSGSLTNFLLSQTPHPSNAWPLNPLRPSLAAQLGEQVELPPEPEEATLAHPAFAPFPSASFTRVFTPDIDLGPSSSLAIPRPSSSSASTRYAPYAQPPSPSVAAASAAWLASPAQSDAPASVGAPTTATATAGARARARIAQGVNPSARTSRSSWREVENEMLARAAASAGGRTSLARSPQPRGESSKLVPAEAEQWAVQVTIQSFSLENKILTGVMRAHGVYAPVGGDGYSPATPKAPADVVTHFTGHMISPLVDGLFASPSPTGAGGPSEFKVSRVSEAESWVQLGPFKGLSEDELLTKARNPEWVEERTRGWVLWRLKERGFVNVRENESSLSISGFYHVCTNRQTGETEGLYSDPIATPFQRLTLSPCNAGGSFSSGTFSYR
ncbi:hypothetical protein JCM11641_007185 [Rhodosporidiobolus odoratus]